METVIVSGSTAQARELTNPPLFHVMRLPEIVPLTVAEAGWQTVTLVIVPLKELPLTCPVTVPSPSWSFGPSNLTQLPVTLAPDWLRVRVMGSEREPSTMVPVHVPAMLLPGEVGEPLPPQPKHSTEKRTASERRKAGSFPMM